MATREKTKLYQVDTAENRHQTVKNRNGVKTSAKGTFDVRDTILDTINIIPTYFSAKIRLRQTH